MESDHALEALRTFAAARDWDQFHSEENLAKSISIEAAELLENFQWGSPDEMSVVVDELADVLTYCFLLANKLGVDPINIVMDKLNETARKYPIDKSRGRSTKYDRL